MSSDNQVTVHLTEEELERIDALLPRYSTTSSQAMRADVLRALVDLGLHAIETSDPPTRAEG